MPSYFGQTVDLNLKFSLDINRFMRMSRRKTTNLEKLHNDSLISMEGTV